MSAGIRAFGRLTAASSAGAEVQAVTLRDAETLISLANHSYRCLDGEGTIAGRRLQIAADHYLPPESDLLLTGAIADVAGAI